MDIYKLFFAACVVFLPIQNSIADDCNGNGMEDALELNPSPAFGLIYFADRDVQKSDLAAADFDNDGLIEFALPSEVDGTVTIIDNNGGASGATPPVYRYAAGASGPKQVVAADFNGDGAADVVTVNSEGTASLLLNRGFFAWSPDSFDSARLIPLAGQGKAIASGDIDGDGDEDLVVVSDVAFVSPGVSGFTVSILENDSSGNFDAPRFATGAVNSEYVAVRDFDGDGDLDILDARFSTSGNPGGLYIHLNDGAGTFSQTVLAYSALPQQTLVAFDDFNRDGLQDIAVATFSPPVTLLINEGGAIFRSETPSFATSTPVASLLAADVDGNGAPDLLLLPDSANSSDFLVLFNDGQGQFDAQSPQLFVTDSFAMPRKGLTGDFDNDGFNDFAVLQGNALAFRRNLMPLPGQDVDKNSILDACEPGKLRSPVFLPWNGFLAMNNVLEISNPGEAAAKVIVKLRSAAGELRGSREIEIAPGRQFDVLVNLVEGFAANQIGVLEIEFDQPIDGRLMQYRSSRVEGEFEFVLSQALTNGIQGKSVVLFNTFNPSVAARDADDPVYQWLSLLNLDAERVLRLLVLSYSESGEILSKRRVELQPMQRIDLEAGHQIAGPNRFGMHVILPERTDVRYLAFLNRYGVDNDAPAGDSYSFATTSFARKGVGGREQALWLEISTGGGSDNWIEFANPTYDRVHVTLEFFDSFSGPIIPIFITLEPFRVEHLNAGQFVPNGRTGAIRLTSFNGVASAIVADSLFYYRNLGGELASTYLTTAASAFERKKCASYNLFVGTYNWLRLFNTGGTNVFSTVTVYPATGSAVTEVFELPVRSGLNLGLHEFTRWATARDSYGLVCIESGSPGDLTGSLLRLRPSNEGFDFAVSTPLR